MREILKSIIYLNESHTIQPYLLYAVLPVLILLSLFHWIEHDENGSE